MICLILGQIHLVRYEDMVIDPYGTSDEIFKFLRLPPHRLIEDYIKKHTNKIRDGTKSTHIYNPKKNLRKKSKREKMLDYLKRHYNKVPSKHSSLYVHSTSRKDPVARTYLWTKEMKREGIDKIQNACEKPMKTLKYEFV